MPVIDANLPHRVQVTVISESDGGAVVESRISVMFGILVVSLFAVSFPGVSKKVSFLRIPHLVFFIGKHFGTGVILSTAFCHLLPDAFESLHDPAVERRYHGIGKWTGMIILSSLLSIFLVEYASTTYVDHLHAKSSPLPSPEISPPPSRPSPQPLVSTPKVLLPPLEPSCSKSPSLPPSTSLLPKKSATGTAIVPTLQSESTPLLPHGAHRGRKRTKSLCGEDEVLLPLILLNSPRLSKGGLRGLVWGKDMGCICPMGRMVLSHDPKMFGSGDRDLEQEQEQSQKGKEQKPRVGRKRQVIGILVLQLGIMIHSLVIGLTLAVTSGGDFMSLVTAIIFHQLFEGLSLGIRIAALAPAQPPSPALDSPPPSPPLSTSGSRTPSLDTLAPPHEPWRLHWLGPTLSILFAITTPLGMAIGMGSFMHAHPGTSPDQAAHMGLTQGLLSAISAGMLIYAATVEMLGGDFVFGDVAGDHGHSHDHGHGHIDGSEHPVQLPGEVKRSGTGRRVLAVMSLLAGVAGMGLIGLGE